RRAQADGPCQIGEIVDRLVVDLGDDVTCLDAGFGRGRAIHDLGNNHALGNVEAKCLGQVVGQVLTDDTESTAFDLTILDDLMINLHHQVAGNGKADADVAARARQNGGVNADQLAIEV